MKNNKGFSLVELIIVIAIMAILVGVMAPQLIKYIEKSNVSSDTQLCDTIRTAITTAAMDPSVINASDYTTDVTSYTSATELSKVVTGSGSTFQSAVLDTLGVADTTQVYSQLKSSGAKNGTNNIMVQFQGSNSIIVFISGTDNSGTKTTKYSVPSSSTAGAIYSGPAEVFSY